MLNSRGDKRPDLWSEGEELVSKGPKMGLGVGVWRQELTEQSETDAQGVLMGTETCGDAGVGSQGRGWRWDWLSKVHRSLRWENQ